MMDGIFQRKDRKGYFISWVNAQGRRRKRKAKGSTLAEARAERAAEITRLAQAQILGFAPPAEDTFKDVAERFLTYQHARLTARGYDRERWIVRRRLLAAFPGKLSVVRRGDVQRYVTERSAQVSAATVQKELNVLKHLLRLAVEWEIIPINPGQGVKGPRVGPGRLRYLQPAELRVLLEACAEWLQPIVGLAVTTGMRRSEILGLRWLDVDRDNQRVLLPHTKNGEGRVVYLNHSAMQVVETLAAGATDLKPVARLFPKLTPEQVSMAFVRTCRTVEIADFHFHDLRHTAASWLRMSGADIHTVAQILGQKDLRMAARYAHLSPGFLSEAVGRLDAVFGDLRPHSVPEPKALPQEIDLTLVN
jgi:integrase